MKKTYYLFTFLLLIFNQSFSQNKHKSVTHDLPQNVIYDFAKAVNYSWNYANNTDAFKGAIIPMLQRRGIYSPFDIEKTIQDVGKSKNCRDLVLGALSDYTGLGRLNEILLNMDVPANSARILTAYAYNINKANSQKATQIPKNIGTNKQKVELPSINGTKFYVTEQIAYLYNIPGDKKSRQKSYLVLGQTVTAIKEKNNYIYGRVTDPITKETTKGWVSKKILDLQANIDSTNINLQYTNSIDNPMVRTNVDLITTPEDIITASTDSTTFTIDELQEFFHFPFDDKNTIYGIITNVQHDNQYNPSSVIIYFKDKKQYTKGFYDIIAIDGVVNPTDHLQFAMTPEKLTLFKKVLVPGRKVAYQTMWKGTSAGHEALTYIKALSKSTVLPQNN